MNLPEMIAVAMLPVAFCFCAPKAPLSAAALSIAFVANLLYAYSLDMSGSVMIGSLSIAEFMRWISALVGLVGALEFGRGVERTKRRMPVALPDILKKIDAATWIGLLLLASMGVDGFGMIVFRAFDVWIVPQMTTGILLLVIVAGLFGKENGT